MRLLTDPPGKVEIPAVRNLFVAIHSGRSVYMACQRGGQKHRGLLVHGDIDIVPPYTPSIWEPQDKDTALILSLDALLLEEVAQDSGIYADRLEFVNRFQIRDPQMEKIGWAFQSEMESSYAGGRVFFDSLSTALAACLVARHSSRARSTVTPKGGMGGRRLRQVLSYIEDNLARDLSLSQIAEVAGVSVSHCKMIFRQDMGVPVHQYIIQRRVERAKVLLHEGKLGVSEIARDTGFAHHSHLATHMRRLLGASPKVIRDRHRQE